MSVVVLPDPDGPSNVRNSPRSISRSSASTMRVTPSYVLPMPTKRTIGSATLIGLPPRYALRGWFALGIGPSRSRQALFLHHCPRVVEGAAETGQHVVDLRCGHDERRAE